MRQLSVERRRIVVMASSVAAMSGVVPLLATRHPRFVALWLGCMAGLLVVAIAHLAKLQKAEGAKSLCVAPPPAK